MKLTRTLLAPIGIAVATVALVPAVASAAFAGFGHAANFVAASGNPTLVGTTWSSTSSSFSLTTPAITGTAITSGSDVTVSFPAFVASRQVEPKVSITSYNAAGARIESTTEDCRLQAGSTAPPLLFGCILTVKRLPAGTTAIRIGIISKGPLTLFGGGAITSSSTGTITV